MKHKLYVIEGVDGTGKTTLGKELASSLGGVYYKGLPKTLKPLKRFVDEKMPSSVRYLFYTFGNVISYLELWFLLDEAPVVVDQSAYCTKAFHSVSFNTKLSPLIVQRTPTNIIYLTAPWNEIDRRLNERGGRKNLEDLEYLKKVDQAYRDLFKDLPNVIYFENHGEPVQEQVVKLLHKLGIENQ